MVGPAIVRAVLFDAVGTLFRVRGSVGAAYAEVARRHGVVVAAAVIEARFRAAFRTMPAMCFPEVSVAQVLAHEQAWWKRVVAAAFAGTRFADFDAFFLDLFAHFGHGSSWELFQDTRPALATLRARGLRLGVVSNFDGRLAGVCEELGIATGFDVIAMSSRVGYAKPDPRIFAVALARLGVAAADAVHVGDSGHDDIEGARAAGLRALLIRRDAAATAAPDEVHDLSELAERIARGSI